MNARFNGYALAGPAEEDREITHVERGTPCGELMRRYWQPVALISELRPDRPLALRILGEDLVLFRDGSGSLGLLHAACSHRGSSLEYGIVSQHGIRCCYHGWLFAVDGTILETPGEPPSSPICRKVTQGAYPVREYRGIVFAYMGPSEHLPGFPVFDTFEQAGVEMVPYAYAYPCNWLQTAENVIDPFHAVFLHTRVSGVQFSPAFGELPLVVWREMPSGAGIYLFNVRRVGDHLWIRIQESFRPNFSQTGDIWQSAGAEKVFNRVGLSKWIVPIDSTHCRIIGWRYFGPTLDVDARGDRTQVGLESIDFPGQTPNRDYDNKQLQPGDYEAIVSQGKIASHAREHLGATDTGVGMLRYKLRQTIRKLAADPSLPTPTLGAGGLRASYTQDTVLNIPSAVDDDLALRRRIGEHVARIVVETDTLHHDLRPAAIRQRILTELGAEFPTIRLPLPATAPPFAPEMS